MSQQAPTLPGPPLLGHLLQARRDPLALLQRGLALGAPVVRYRLGSQPTFLVCQPEGIRRVMQDHAANYDKRTRSTALLHRITGESLLTANDEAWKTRRQTVAPLLHRQALAGMESAMREEASRWVKTWRESAGREWLAWPSCRRFTLAVVIRTLFGVVEEGEAENLRDAMDVLLRETLSSWLALPAWVPSPGKRRFDAAIRRAHAVTLGLLGRALREERPGPLLQLLLGDQPLPEELSSLLPECVTLLLAGHDTTACALAWAVYELARHPEQADALRAGLEDGLDRFIREVLRLHPPIWVLERRAIAADEISGIGIPAGSSVLISPYALQRDPRLWENPDVFDPDRFKTRPAPVSWIPFGLGARFCVGAEFAMMELRIGLKALLANTTFTPAWLGEVRAAPAITLMPASTLAVKLGPHPSAELIGPNS